MNNTTNSAANIVREASASLPEGGDYDGALERALLAQGAAWDGALLKLGQDILAVNDGMYPHWAGEASFEVALAEGPRWRFCLCVVPV